MKFEMPTIEAELFNIVDVITASAAEPSEVTTMGEDELPIG